MKTICWDCKGTGTTNNGYDDNVICDKCNGIGKIERLDSTHEELPYEKSDRYVLSCLIDDMMHLSANVLLPAWAKDRIKKAREHLLSPYAAQNTLEFSKKLSYEYMCLMKENDELNQKINSLESELNHYKEEHG